MNTSVPQSEEENGSRRRGGGGSKRAGTAVKEETQGKRRLAEQESPPSLGYDWFFPCARMTTKKKIKTKGNSKWCSKNKDERGRGGFACWDVVLAVVLLLFFILFRKATLGFDAVVIVRGLAAATGFGL